jgi:ribose/xylose/arabinose/galactoside ABC-type transport system permease subunit
VITKEGIPLALIAIGAAIVLSSAGVDLSSAGVVTAAGIVFAVLTQAGLSPFIATIITSLLGVLAGIAVGWCAYERISPLIASWAIGTLLLTISLWFASEATAWTIGTNTIASSVSAVRLGPGAIDSTWNLTGPAVRLSVVVLSFLIALLYVANIPRRCSAVGASIDSARFIGLPVKRIVLLSYISAGTLSAVAGAIFARVNNQASTTQFIGFELTGIAIAVLGGTLLSGGYLCIPSVVTAALFWAVTVDLLHVLPVPTVLEPHHSRIASAVFASAILAVLVLARKKVRQLTQMELIEGRTDDA